MSAADAVSCRHLRPRLLRWYDRVRRPLPWRECPHDAYRQWLAESMAQQTQVATVIPYYERFCAAFPTVDALAAAPLDAVLRMWAGLGYYARARNLHAAARQIVDCHGGRFPSTVEGLQSLPGVGRYTAGAVASIVFDRRAAVVDGNVARVLSRLYAVGGDPRRSPVRKTLWTLAERILPRRRCGDFNQALMELGATVCTPRNPQCPVCPLTAQCQARALGRVDAFPAAAPRKPARAVDVAVAAVHHRGRWLLRQRPLDGLWGGLWELPSAEVATGGRIVDALRSCLVACGVGSRCEAPAVPVARVAHALTHRRLQLHVFLCPSRTSRQPVRPSPGRQWLSDAELEQVALGRAQRKALNAARGAVGGGRSATSGQ